MLTNTNITSLSSQTQLNTNQKNLASVLEKLSSGLRINSAKDDAAGLAIASRMETQIKGMGQAMRNAMDAISISEVTEGGLVETSNMLQRIRELSVQAANGTNNSSDRAALQQEVSVLVEQVNKIADTTKFNGIQVLNGELNNMQFQIGYEANDTISLDQGKRKAIDLGVNKLNLGNIAEAGGLGSIKFGDTIDATSDSVEAQTLTVNGTGVSIAADDSAKQIVAKLNEVEGTTGVSASASTVVRLDKLSNSGTVNFSLHGNNKQDDTSASAVSVSANIADINDLTNLKDAINKNTSTHGIVADFDVNSSGAIDKSGIVMRLDGGEDIIISDFTHSASSATAATQQSGAMRVTNNVDTPQQVITSKIYGGETAGLADMLDVFDDMSAAHALEANTLTIISDETSSTGVDVAVGAADTIFQVAANINNVKQQTGVFAKAFNEVILSDLKGGTGGNGLDLTISFSNTGTDVPAQLFNVDDVTSISELVYDINAAIDVAGPAEGSGALRAVLNTDGTASLISDLGYDIAIAVEDLNVNGDGEIIATSKFDSQITAKLDTADDGGIFGAQLTLHTDSESGFIVKESSDDDDGLNFDLLTSSQNTNLSSTELTDKDITLTNSGSLIDKVGAEDTNNLSDSVHLSAIVSLESRDNFSVSSSVAGTAGSLIHKGAGVGKSSNLSHLESIDISSISGANKALSIIDGALDMINADRAYLGAKTNQFDSQVNNLDIAKINVTAAKSRIMDVDFAAETANLSKAQILQQAASSVLSQANQMNQVIAQLLQG